MAGVLEGIRVLDFGRYIAAPFCAALLADMGAEVIRIDREGGNEDRWMVPVTRDGEGCTFLQVNRNKMGITLDITTPEGREALNELIATADVVVTNMPKEALKGLGLDYETIAKIKPDIICTNVSTFGSIGRYRNRIGFDMLAQAMAGPMHMTGDGKTPMRAGVPFCDYGTALCAALGTLAAIIERQKSGKGQLVEAALLHTALTMTSGFLIEQALLKTNRRATVNRSPVSGPSDCFKTKDGWIFLAAISNPIFKRLCNMLGEQAWLTDPRFKDDLARGDNGEILSERMQQWCSERTSDEAIAALEKARIPCGPVFALQQTLEDPHIREEGFLQPTTHPALDGAAPLVTTPFRLSRTPCKIERPAPTLGQHNAKYVKSRKRNVA
jgi:crotonobetainyl-CoA:carnitine CoA-transferase CaiB-like acyl-CoA transferase